MKGLFISNQQTSRDGLIKLKKLYFHYEKKYEIPEPINKVITP